MVNIEVLECILVSFGTCNGSRLAVFDHSLARIRLFFFCPRGHDVDWLLCRSVTMDAWNPDQLKKMQSGGNGAMNDFFAKYGVAKNVDVREKYNSPPAEFYREMIKARVEGRDYTPPNPSTVKKMAGSLHGDAGARSRSGNDGWGLNDSRSESANSRGDYRMEDLERSAASKDDFFARKQMENAMRPEGLPPSQGGKYVGFGSQPATAPKRQTGQLDDVAGIVTKGFSELSMFAKTKAVEMNDALQEAGVAEKTKEYGAKGWSLLRTAYASAASTIEKTAAQQGYQIDLGSKKVSDGVHAPRGAGRYSSIDAPPPDGHGFEEERAFEFQNSKLQHSAVQQEPIKAPECITAKQDNLLDVDDDWADWDQSAKEPERAGKQEIQAGWDGWDDDASAQKRNGVKTSSSAREDEKDDSWGTW